MCTGRLDPQLVLKAFAREADGVLILGCRLGECHYKEGNLHALKRFLFLKNILPNFGIEEERLRIEWVSATDHQKLVRIINEMDLMLRRMGPLNTGRARQDKD